MSGATVIEVFETPTFKKAFKKLPESDKVLVEDEIEKIIADPEIGEPKKGDLAYLWVHKFKLKKRLVLLGYSWQADQLHLYLMHMGSHENFYRDAKKRRHTDLKTLE